MRKVFIIINFKYFYFGIFNNYKQCYKKLIDYIKINLWNNENYNNSNEGR